MTLVLLLVVVGANPKSADVDPAAVAALQKMTASVRELTALSVRALVETDEVLESGQRVTRTSAIALTVHRPNRLHADVKTERSLRQLFYDGESFTIWSPRSGYYASTRAPGTIADLVVLGAERFAFELPFTDVFPWEPLEHGELRSARDLGATQLEGVDCEHYAFQQSGLEWEVWIEKGLPRKVRLGDRRVTYSWNLGLPDDDEAQFTFTPPKDARKIELTERK
jgi:hypothetical protein